MLIYILWIKLLVLGFTPHLYLTPADRYSYSSMAKKGHFLNILMWLRTQDGALLKYNSQLVETLVLLLLNLPDTVPCSLYYNYMSFIKWHPNYCLVTLLKTSSLNWFFQLSWEYRLKCFLCPITEIDYLSCVFDPLPGSTWAYAYCTKKP